MTVGVALAAGPVKADPFAAQILPPAGGTIHIVAPSQPFSGFFQFGASNIQKDTAVQMLGNSDYVKELNSPSPSQSHVYEVVYFFLPAISTAFTVSGTTTLVLNVPPSVSSAKPLDLYWGNVVRPAVGSSATPPPVAWSAPIAGSRSNNQVTFVISDFNNPVNTEGIIDIMQ